MATFTLVLVIAVALAFDFTNGFHDTANSIATVVSTRALPPRVAVVLAAGLNFLGAFLSIKVAATIAGLINTNLIQGQAGLKILLAGLIGAIGWNLTTWYFGLPTSSSHALIGGMLGSAITALGLHANDAHGEIQHVVNWSGLYEKVLIPSLGAPLLAIPVAMIVMLIFLVIIRRRSPERVNRFFRHLQPFSGGWLAFTHGTNDAQKTMGVIALALIVSGHIDPAHFYVPTWVIASAAGSMALGTYAGGWRIIRTVGQRIAKIEPPRGFAAEITAGSVLWATQHFGYPVSTTHTVSSAVLGAGAAGSRLSAVRWGVAGNILVAWLMTIPCAGAVGALTELLTRLPGGIFLALALVCGIGLLAFSARTRRPSLAVVES
ncbi:MAG: anion permease [Gaiellaceae bacterium]